MRRPSARVRPAIPLAGGLVVLAALGVRSVGSVAEHRSARARDRMVGIAATINDPEGLATRRRGRCADQTFLIRCLEGPQDPDTLTALYRDALSVSSGRAASARCETVQSRTHRTRDCLVRIDDGAHAVLVSITSRRVDRPGGFAFSGSEVRIDAV